jgi:hypothetical protein
LGRVEETGWMNNEFNDMKKKIIGLNGNILDLRFATRNYERFSVA